MCECVQIAGVPVTVLILIAVLVPGVLLLGVVAAVWRRHRRLAKQIEFDRLAAVAARPRAGSSA